MNAKGKQQSGGHAIKLDLHIGTEKTGTTSFQNWMEAEHGKLGRKGVICPVWPKRFLHSFDNRMLSVIAQGFNPGDDWQRKAGVRTAARYAELCDDFSHVFTKEINRRGEGRWIISGEHMQSRLENSGQVQRLGSFLQPHFSEIVVHIHLRPQIDLARSVVSTVTRLGLPVTQANLNAVKADNPYYNYAALVARWEDVFGAANVRVIPYKRVPSIRGYFLDLWQLDAADFGPEPRLNRAIDWRAIALMNTIHPHRLPITANIGLQGAISALPAKASLQFGLARAQDITKRFAASNETLIAARPDLTINDLTPNWDEYDHPENFSRINPACDFAAEAAGIIGELQSELILERARTCVFQAENLLLMGKKMQAKVKLNAATDLLLQIEPLWKNRKSFMHLRHQITKVVLDGLA